MTRLRAGHSWFESRQGQDIPVLSKSSRHRLCSSPLTSAPHTLILLWCGQGLYIFFYLLLLWQACILETYCLLSFTGNVPVLSHFHNFVFYIEILQVILVGLYFWEYSQGIIVWGFQSLLWHESSLIGACVFVTLWEMSAGLRKACVGRPACIQISGEGIGMCLL